MAWWTDGADMGDLGPAPNIRKARKITRHLEIQIRVENPPVPELEEIKAMAENQDGNAVACGALRTLPLPARRRELRPQVTSLPLPTPTLSGELEFDIFQGAREGCPICDQG